MPIITFGQKVTVVDNQGLVLPGVEVFSEDYSVGEITDDKGIIELQNVPKDLLLHFRFLGYVEFSATLAAIAEQDYRVRMQPSNQIIEEVVVLGRKEVNQSEIPFQIKSISLKDIQSTHSQTSADALAQHGGVYVQKSQMGGGSPVIRGFEANRVLLVLDGIRLNNAIYRNGHLQNAISVDQAMLEKMEVVFGPNSLIYGSDALGGVVNFKTRNPLLSLNDDARTEIQYYSRYASANNENSAHVDVSVGSKKFGSLTSLTYSSYGDLRVGNNRDDRFPDFGKRFTYQGFGIDGNDIEVTNEDVNVQVGTGYNQFDLLQKFLFIPNIRHRFTANIQLSTGSDVPRYDNLSEVRNGSLRWAEWNYGPQKRLMTSLDYRHLKPTRLYDQLIVIGAYQRIDEDRITRRFNNTEREYQMEDVSVYSATVDFSKYLNEKQSWELEYGADIQHNNVNSNAFAKDISTGLINDNQLSRYASDGNRLTNFGGFLYVKGKSVNDQFNYNAGIRFAQSNYYLQYDRNDPVDWPASFYEGVDGSNTALTWSVGGTWASQEGFQIRSIISTAFRSPNIDDLSKIRVNGEEITFPNLNLKPERSTNAELTLAYQSRAISNFSVTGFYTRLNDAIVRSAFFGPGGERQWISQNEILDIVGNQNIQSGEIYGVSTNVSGNIADHWKWEGSLNFTHGREIESSGERTPLAHIPPLYGKVGIDFKRDKWNVKFAYRFNGSKPVSEYGGSADNLDLATPIGALAWSTFNIYMNYDLSDQVSFSLSAENMFDKYYRPFASGVGGPGRNFIISVRGKL